MNAETLHFIEAHLDADVRQLALQGCRDKNVDLTLALQQIAGRQTARRKLPTWAACDGILYPPHLNMEQCSSEPTARYKAGVIGSLKRTAPTTLVDLTGGFGVDFSFIAPLFDKAVYVEQQEGLCQLAVHNFEELGIKAEVICTDAAAYLQQLLHATVIFLDPARRDQRGARTYGISDCTPDVLTMRDELLQKTDFVMLKLSPMLDWRKTVEDLGRQWVREVHIVSTGGECKELLVVLSKAGEGLRLVCVNDQELFVVEQASEQNGETMDDAHPAPDHFLYEPNASLMKAGCFAELSRHYGIRQLSQNSHLFVSDSLIDDFPGRRFRIKEVSTMNKRELKEKITPLKQANITVRNFPLSVAELRKRLKLSEGGNSFLFATTLANGNHILILTQKA